MDGVYRLTASQALILMQNESLSVEDYTKSLLSRIEQRDRAVKAWAYLDPEFVLAQARRLDQVPREDRGPLHGIPIGVKDVMLTKDMPTGYNSGIYMDDLPALVDAAPIITLRAAGALIFGKTTTTEFAAVTDGGPSTNPHSPARTPGGSSSGSGAAVADFQVPIALDWRVNNSPASFNGILGFKPTWGAISREGLGQHSMTCDTFGIFARSVEDLELFSKVFRLEDDIPVPPVPYSAKGARVAFCKTHVWPKSGPGTKAVWERAQEILSKHGSIVEEVDLPREFGNLKDWHANVLAGEGRSSFLGNYLLAKEKLNKTILGMVENPARLSRKAQLESYDGCARLRPIWDEIANKYDAVITPSVVDEAPVGVSHTGDAAFCSMWTILHAPALNIPGFLGENDLPIGLTLVGPRYHDSRLLYVGKAFGTIF